VLLTCTATLGPTSVCCTAATVNPLRNSQSTVSAQLLGVAPSPIDLRAVLCRAVLCRAVLCLQDTWRDVPYDMASLLENVLDASHVPFTHHK
jgi:phenylpropionate dioxygenase-like ring-hydroxylating dioxygenase large terminal subunit